MFSKSQRLPLPVRGGAPWKTIPTPYFLLRVFENRVGCNRFGIIISNAAVKRSSKRHFWKRRIAEFLKDWPNLNKDVLVIISPRIEEITLATLKLEFQKILQKALRRDF